MTGGDRLSGAAFLLLALVAIWEAGKLPLGQLSLPGPGFQPFWAAVALGVLSLALVLRAGVRGPREAQASPSGWAGWRKAVVTMAALVGYGLLLKEVGYLLATGGLVALFLVLERQRWPIVLAVALGAALASYWLFAVWLQVPLPRGLLER